METLLIPCEHRRTPSRMRKVRHRTHQALNLLLCICVVFNAKWRTFLQW